MNLKKLSSDDLLRSTCDLVREERRISVEVLKHLLEIDTRRIYAERGYSSLFEFCRHELGYSDGAAYRRVNAMHLMRDLPVVQDKICSGELTVSAAAQVQGFLAAERRERGRVFDQNQKHELLDHLVGKSRREVERELVKLSPERGAERPEQERALAQDRVELCLSISRDLHERLKRIQDLTAHVNPWSTYENLLEHMTEIVLNKIDPMRKKLKAI
jgi:hypothetical protein